ncbi:caspase-8 [Kryptolebias marmoratus]|uniref:Caspase-8 n=1 Tax=Kryptolebias marmoratus TaxID=37003 RepID=A0A3Q3AJ36_KRYMA|nr:caspase-8 [Kryptolebias marmoratus]
MDLLLLSKIDEGLVSSEVAELCFLCSDMVNRKRLEGITDAKKLFERLDERGLLENPSFLSQLLHTIHRADLRQLLSADGGQQGETDANPILSEYRVMLYKVHENITNENLGKMKYLLTYKLGKNPLEKCITALDVFAEMERMGEISKTNVNNLHKILLEFDQQLAVTVQNYMDAVQRQQTTPPAGTPANPQRPNNTPQSQPRNCGRSVSFDSSNEEYYSLTRTPRGSCVIFNNKHFRGKLQDRAGTEKDANALSTLFDRFGFRIETYHDLSADKLQRTLAALALRDFSSDDALVICILSHGEKGCVFGSDERKVSLQDLTSPFTSDRAPTLEGKPKVFFVQACQNDLQEDGQEDIQEDAQTPFQCSSAAEQGSSFHVEADFLIGMATVQNSPSFRHRQEGSIYIQQLCKQLTKSAESPERDDILGVLTRVNKEVGKGEYAKKKQMPEPRYTLTKKLAFRFP